VPARRIPLFYNNELYFSATDGGTGIELWKYDGSATTRVADINPGSANSNPASLTVYNGVLYFAATDISSGRQLWQYDGTTVSRFAEINPGSGGSSFGAGEIF